MIELADSSTARDLGVKRTLYARFAIPDYIVVDINREAVIHHSSPADGEYRRIETHAARATFRFASIPNVEIAASVFLQPPSDGDRADDD